MRRPARRRPVGAALVALVMLLTASCGSDEAAGGGAGSGAPIGTGGGAGTAGGQSVPTVQMNSFSYTPPKLTVESGATVTVRNGNAATPHTFTIRGEDIDVEGAPLASEDVVIDLPPGEYTFYCRFHEAQDMEGTLTVE